ncbi:DUF6011 domain-containing protein [Gordonia sp. ABSL49_1]|uniref:DUF6011 domain-containing protein n=1 Tax=Gordonia sp. ABSL49_1 TaxID=2920941 RepID=UPI001F1157EE|nr:DUF6011 domain-containing protein [Gordonia sp. ABSL49_1]MCH5645677.1 DUF6011 domain-containing protein [Gordonia sp. ABSL49_1]
MRNPAGANGGAPKDSAGGGNLDIESINLDAYLDPADRLMLAALREGNYVLAVVCRVCGSPLTAKRSRQLGVGPDCRKRVAG